MREIRLVRGVEKESPEKAEEVFKGPLKKPMTSTEKLDAKMEKVEKHTQELLTKAENRREKSEAIKNKSKQLPTDQEQVDTHQEQLSRATKIPTIYDFYCLKGLPKKILGHFKTSAQYDEQLGQWIAVVDTEQLKEITGKTASHLSVQILRLEKQGWFKLLQSSNSGMRVIQINPEAFPVKQ